MEFASDLLRPRNATWKRGWSCAFHGVEARAVSTTLLRYTVGWGALVLPADHALLCRASALADAVKIRVGARPEERPYALDAVAIADADQAGVRRSESALALRMRAWGGDLRTEIKLVDLNLASRALAALERPKDTDDYGALPQFKAAAGVVASALWRPTDALTVGAEVVVLAREREQPAPAEHPAAVPNLPALLRKAYAPAAVPMRPPSDC